MARLDGSGTSGRGCGIGGLWIGRSGDLGLGRRFRSTVEVSGFKILWRNDGTNGGVRLIK